MPIRDGVWQVRAYPRKAFQIQQDRKCEHKTPMLWDARNFSAEVWRQQGKEEFVQSVTQYTLEHVRRNWNSIAQYCLSLDPQYASRVL